MLGSPTRGVHEDWYIILRLSSGFTGQEQCCRGCVLVYEAVTSGTVDQEVLHPLLLILRAILPSRARSRWLLATCYTHPTSCHTGLRQPRNWSGGPVSAAAVSSVFYIRLGVDIHITLGRNYVTTPRR